MSTMSEMHRLMQEIKQDDLDILADIERQNRIDQLNEHAYQMEEAMRNEYDADPGITCDDKLSSVKPSL